MNKKTQKGFAILEALLILVIVGLIGGTGYYVLHSKSQTDKTLDAAAIQKITRPISKTSQSTTRLSRTPTPSDSPYLQVKEWGIKIKMRDADNLSLEIHDTQGGIFYTGNYDGYAKPSFKPEALVDKNCEPGVSLFRALNQPEGFNATKISGYYYWVTGGPGACSNDTDNQLKTRFLSDFSPENIQPI